MARGSCLIGDLNRVITLQMLAEHEQRAEALSRIRFVFALSLSAPETEKFSTFYKLIVTIVGRM